MSLQKRQALLGAIHTTIIIKINHKCLNYTYILEYEVLCLERLKVGLVFLSPQPLIQQRALQPSAQPSAQSLLHSFIMQVVIMETGNSPYNLFHVAVLPRPTHALRPYLELCSTHNSGLPSFLLEVGGADIFPV